MDDSKFNLWRACFSFCFIDGFLDPAEKKWIEDKLNSLKFSDEQKKTLLADLNNPPAIDKLLPLITKPADRGFLVNNLRQLSKLDHVLSDSEKSKIQIVREAVISKIDMVGLDKIIEADEKASYHEDEVYKVHNKSSYVERTFRGLQKIMNPGDYKFPDKE